MNFHFKYTACFIFIAVVVSCRKPYSPPAIALSGSYLVVEGVINSGADTTLIKLSKTVNLSSAVTINPLSGAVVTVLSDQGAVYPLTETAKGSYISPGLNLDNSRTYRLSIKTSTEQYLSDFEAVKSAPPVDSVTYAVQSDGIKIFANTHDPNNNTRYYRWDYTETWVFHSSFQSSYKSNGDTVVMRNQPADQIYYCYKSDTSSTILLGSSAKLAADVISNAPITSIAPHSEKLTEEYSILLRQYALTGAAYTFWQNLKTNTEKLGGIFDAQPSNISSNIHSVTNPSEPVIGYLSVGAVSSQRIFISSYPFPVFWTPTPIYADCLLTDYLLAYYPPQGGPPINQENEFFNVNKGAIDPQIPVQAIVDLAGNVIGHTGAPPECVDCTLRGTNVQPSFWKVINTTSR